MGLFGRDDRSNGQKPPPTEAKPRQGQASTTGSATTLVAKTTQIEGEIKGAGEVRIEGSVKGTINCTARVLVDPGGRVDGELQGETVVIAGAVKGNVHGTQKIELTPTAEVEGDITSPRILIREGATFEGQVNMTGKKSVARPEPKTDDGPESAKVDDDEDE
jgi:cytoskeletal protein CcmA (bactofilin family)